VTGALSGRAWRYVQPYRQTRKSKNSSPVGACESPDVFSIRNSTVQACMEPIVHKIKVSRADVLGDLKNKGKRDAYLDLGGQCWYVLGCNAKGNPIADADEIPGECGVMVYVDNRLGVKRHKSVQPYSCRFQFG
jgi:hypothetical protein